MSRSRAFVASGLCLLAVSLLLLVQNRARHEDHDRLRLVLENEDANSKKIRAQEAEIVDLTGKLAASEKDNTALLAAVDDISKQTPSAASSPRRQRITHAEVESRYKRAGELAKAGRSEEALADFLWCYDEGMIAVSSFTGVRSSFLVSEIARLGKNYPTALDALRVRRDHLTETLDKDPSDSEALSDYASLNHALKDDAKNIELFEKLPAGDERRARFGFTVYKTLADSKRYAEALEAYPYHYMTSSLGDDDFLFERPGISEQVKVRHRSSTLRSAANNLEVLIGAGKSDQAKAYAAKMVVYEDTPATRQLIRDAAAKAGRPDFPIP